MRASLERTGALACLGRTRSARLALGPVLFVLTVLAAGCGADGDSDTAAVQSADGDDSPLLLDVRVERLLDACRDVAAFDRNLSDTLPILLDKLDRGQGVPLKRALEELGALGERSLPDLRRRYREDERDAAKTQRLTSTLTAVALNPTEGATELLLEALTHTDGMIRAQAMRGLQAREFSATLRERVPDLYERIANAVRFNQLQNAADEGMAAMHRLDPERAEQEFLQLLDVRSTSRLWPTAVAYLGASQFPATLEGMRTRVELLPPLSAVFLRAALARAGDEAQREKLLEQLGGGDLDQRLAAVRASAAAELWEFVDAAAATDSEPLVRRTALAQLGDLLAEGDFEAVERKLLLEPNELAQNALSRALDDTDRELRDAALVFGVELGLPEALERALSQLTGGRRELELILPTLRGRLRDDPVLAQRALERLLPELEARADEPAGDKLQLLTTLGQVPLATSADLLLDMAAEPAEPIESLPAHRWIALQAASTGVPGRRRIYERLPAERDPQRRLDLLFAIAAERDDFAREALLAHVDSDEPMDPYERLYAASLLANLGPSDQVAKVIKRASIRVDGRARIGFWCLLRTWY